MSLWRQILLEAGALTARQNLSSPPVAMLIVNGFEVINI